MQYYNVKIQPEGLLEPGALYSEKTQSQLNMTRIIVRLEVHAMELLGLVQMVGANNLTIEKTRQATLEELCDDLNIDSNTLPVDHNMLWGSTLYTCQVVFTGMNILRLTGSDYTSAFVSDEESGTYKLKSDDRLVFEGLIPEMYNTIYNRIINPATENVTPVMKYDLYRSAVGANKTEAAEIRYIYNDNGYIDFRANDDAFKEQFTSFMSAAQSTQSTTATIIWHMDIATYTELRTNKPSCISILHVDPLNEVIPKHATMTILDESKSGGSENQKVDYIRTAYTMPLAAKINCVISIRFDSDTTESLIKYISNKKSLNDILIPLINNGVIGFKKED